MSATPSFGRDVQGRPWSPGARCPHPTPGACPARGHARLCDLAGCRGGAGSDLWRERVRQKPPEIREAPASAHLAPVAIPAGTEVLVVSRARPGMPDRGLGVNSDHTAGELARLGIPAAGVQVLDVAEVPPLLAACPTVRVVLLQALWGDLDTMRGLAERHPAVCFLVRCHSNIGFLQCDPGIVAVFRGIAGAGLPNLGIAGVSARFAEVFARGLDLPCLHLPNLYAPDPPSEAREPDDGIRPVRVGSFGATRVQKHHHTAAAAALLLARKIRRPVEFHINDGRAEGGETNGVKVTIRDLLHNVPGVRLVEHLWMPAGAFRRLAGTMDLGVQLSSTETFNIVTADLAAAGVPSVVSAAIEWMPPRCLVPIDDPGAVADRAAALLADPESGPLCRAALDAHRAHAATVWLDWLGTLPPRPEPPLPPIGRQVRSFAASAAAVVVSGGRRAATEVHAARLAACTAPCDHYRPSDGRCGRMTGCGCFVREKARWAASGCPLGRWPE
jgi:glycosyltransferase involved in cell wall biosynthesis